MISTTKLLERLNVRRISVLLRASCTSQVKEREGTIQISKRDSRIHARRNVGMLNDLQRTCDREKSFTTSSNDIVARILEGVVIARGAPSISEES